MILLYGAGGVPGRDEIHMEPNRYRASDDFLFCILGSRKNEMQRRKPQKVFWGFRGSEMIQIKRKPAKKKSSPKWDLLQENLAEGGEKEVQHK